MSNDVMQFNPLPKQKVFMTHVFSNPIAKFIWYCGGFGSGKSYIGSHTSIRMAMQAPRGRGLIGRSTLVDLKATTMKTFFEVLDRRLIYKWNKSENLLTLINGHEIYFWGLDDIEKLKSLEIGWFWFDEVDETDINTFLVSKGRLRHKAQPMRKGIITSNSEGKNWTYKLFVRGETGDGNKLKPHELAQHYVIKAPSTENTYLPEDYLDVLNSYTGDLYERYVKASFEVFEGQIFKEFNRAIHVIKPFAIPKDWDRIRGVDHGERNPTAVLWAAISPEGDMYIYQEHYEAGKFVDYHANKVAEMSKGEYYEYNVFDPSIKSTRGRTGKKIDKEWREEMRQHEKDFRIRYGVNSVNAGIARVHRYLTVDQDRTHPITGKVGSPRLFIFETCVVTIDEMESYKWKKQPTSSEDDAPEAPRKKDDHTTDVVRYLCMSRPEAESGASIHTSIKRRGKLLALKPDKRDQVLPTIDETTMANMKKLYPDDFLL